MQLDSETIERLLIDRSVGALSSDTEALLAAYLRHDRQAGELARQFDETADLAKQALGVASAPSLPALRTDKLLRVEASCRRWRLFRNAAGLAACLVLGLGLGLILSRNAPSPLPPPSFAVRNSSLANDARDTRSSASDFWSVSRLRDRLKATEPKHTSHLIWDSPVKLPRIGDKS
jgi:hypothetical protein